MAGDEFLKRIAGPSNPYEGAMQRLLQSIRLGFIGPGERLPPERDLAEMLGISRSTVRDALATLTDSGYVVSRRGRYGGTFVVESLPAPSPGDAAVTAEELQDIGVLRRVLEVGAVREVASRDLTAASRSSLIAALEDCSRAEVSDFRRLDSRLHLLFAELTGSNGLVRMTAELRTRVNGLLDRIPLLAPNLSHSHAQHEEIVHAILSGRADAAAASMLEHIEGTEALLQGFLTR